MKALDEILVKCSDVHPLAKGGQKKVIAAVHPQYGSVVIKHGEYRSVNSLERINREVELLKQIDSTYYPKHYEYIIDAPSREFLIVEERIHADVLTSAANQFHNNDALILQLLKELIKALNIIWTLKVIHRDIKPANILLRSDGTPVILDLGIARFLDKESLTLSIAPHGPATLIYAAPEQLLNRKPMIGIRTDFYLLGIVVLELYQGFHPFDPRHVGNDLSIVENILRGIYVPPTDCNPILGGFIGRVLKAEPFRRFRTQQDLASYLRMNL